MKQRVEWSQKLRYRVRRGPFETQQCHITRPRTRILGGSRRWHGMASVGDGTTLPAAGQGIKLAVTQHKHGNSERNTVAGPHENHSSETYRPFFRRFGQDNGQRNESSAAREEVAFVPKPYRRDVHFCATYHGIHQAKLPVGSGQRNRQPCRDKHRKNTVHYCCAAERE
jgi:hypothetical protein